MTLALGKEQVSLGAAPDNDVVLSAPGVAPHHARVIRQGGQLFFVDLGLGPSTANGAPVPPQQPVPFDFRTVFALGAVPVPLSHPALAAMLMSVGQLQVPSGHVVVGRDATRASLVIAHAAVSGQHATVMLDRMVVVDHGSTSGTWVAGHKLVPNQPTPIEPGGIVAFGPVRPIPVAMLGAAGARPPAGRRRCACSPPRFHHDGSAGLHPGARGAGRLGPGAAKASHGHRRAVARSTPVERHLDRTDARQPASSSSTTPRSARSTHRS